MENRNSFVQMMPQLFLKTSILNNETAGSSFTKNIEIVYVLRGQLDVVQRNKRVSLRENDCMLFNSMEEQQLLIGPDALVAQFQLTYDLMILFVEEEKLTFHCCSSEENKETHDGLRAILNEILQNYVKNIHEKHIAMLKLGFQLLHYLLLHYSAGGGQSALQRSKPLNKHNDRLQNICAYMEANYKQPLSLKEVAELHYVSVPYLSKSFKKETGMTFSDYLNKVRLDHALLYLIHTELPVTRIALDNGFPNLTAFNRVFKETYKCSPSQYRKAAIESNQASGTELVVHDEPNERLTEVKELLDRAVQPEAPAVMKLSVDSAMDYLKGWKGLINIGYARDILNSNLQEQLSLVKSELGFSHARFWGIFSDDMLIENPSDPEASYNFSNVDKLIDVLIKNNLKPYIELGDKPKLIQKNVIEKMVTPPLSPKKRDKEDWLKLIRAFIVHCMNRYGIEEVENWYFELWHSSRHAFSEQDLTSSGGTPVLWSTPEEMEKWFNDYFTRFDWVWTAIKDALPNARIGGCGLSVDLEGQHIDLLLHMWKKREIQPDFLSIYLYPYEFSENQGETPVFIHSADPEWILKKLQAVTRSLAAHDFEGLPLHVTEWNFSISNRDFLNDSIFKAAFIIKNITDTLDENCLMGYWMYSDIFSEFRDSKQLLYGGAGLISRDGIKKPAFYAFALLNRMGKKLLGKGEGYLFTRHSGNQYQLLSFNYEHFHMNHHFCLEAGATLDKLGRSLEQGNPAAKRFRIDGLRNGNYRMKKYVLSHDRGSILNEWNKFGAVHDINPDEIRFLQQICVPYISVEHVEVKNGSIIIDHLLHPHEVNLIELDQKI